MGVTAAARLTAEEVGSMGEQLDLSLLGLEPGKLIWGQLGKAWWPARVSGRRLHAFMLLFHEHASNSPCMPGRMDG